MNYSQQQKEGLLLAQDQLFRRMHEVLEKREVIVNTLQTNFPCAETEHKNAPLYVQVWPLPMWLMLSTVLLGGEWHSS